jgi:hypothetical protein
MLEKNYLTFFVKFLHCILVLFCSVVVAEMDEDRGDRPLKYETTRPVSGKRASSASGKLHKGLTFSATVQGNAQQPPSQPSNPAGSHLPNENQHHNSPTNSLNNSMNAAHMQQQQQHQVPAFDENLEDYVYDPATQRPPISVRVHNAITRPECVDRFTADLQNMEQMEDAFRKNTLSLQKKLGLPENGMI